MCYCVVYFVVFYCICVFFIVCVLSVFLLSVIACLKMCVVFTLCVFQLCLVFFSLLVHGKADLRTLHFIISGICLSFCFLMRNRMHLQ